MKKIAFVHDRLYYIAGAEQVFFDMIRERLQHCNIATLQGAKAPTIGNNLKQSETKVFTMFSDKYFLTINNNRIEIVTALPRRIFAIFVFFDKNKIWLFSKLFDYRNLMFFYPLLIWILKHKIKAFNPNETYISSFAVAKNIASTEAQKHNSTIALHAQSPFMYIHNHYESNLSKLTFPIKQLYQLAYQYLKPWDIKPRHYDTITANSHYTAGLIEKIYSFKNTVVQYPKLDPLFFNYPLSTSKSDYFIFVGRLVCFSKQVDIIIQAFNKTGQKLKIIGSGPDEQYLKSIAKPNIEFLGWVSDPQQRCKLISNACALVNITLESFGYVTAESLCLGTPVIGYDKGATPELVGTLASYTNTTSGILIEQQTKEALIHGLEKFQNQIRDHKVIARLARSTFQASNLQFQLS